MLNYSDKAIVALAFLREVFYSDFACTFTDERLESINAAFKQLDDTINDLEFLQENTEELEKYVSELEQENINNAKLYGLSRLKLTNIMNNICDLAELYATKEEKEND